MFKKRLSAAFTAALIAGILTSSVFADNDPNIENRGAGYYSTEIGEYPDLDPIYENAPDFPDITSSFEQKAAKLRESEADYIEVDTDTIVVSCREFNLESHRVFLTHVLVKDPASQIKIGLSHDTFGGERERPSEYAARTNAAVVVNGSYFYYETGKPIDICAPIVINNGEILRSGVTNGSEVIFRNDGTFFSPHPMISFDSDFLLSFGAVSNIGTADPLLISDGIPESFPAGVSDSVYPRTALGVVCSGEYYLITAGANGSYSKGLSYRQMQTIFFKLGCSYARSFDGGGSSAVVINGALKNLPAEGVERPVVDFLAFYGPDYVMPEIKEDKQYQTEESSSVSDRINRIKEIQTPQVK